jgi:hypothetical protein
MDQDLSRPSPDLVIKRAAEYDNHPQYHDTERCWQWLVAQFPVNVEIDTVAMKVCAVDHMLQTGLGYSKASMYDVAKHVMKVDFDERVKANDISVVDELAMVPHSQGTPARLFSLATKFTAVHAPDRFYIYDSRVAGYLKFAIEKFGGPSANLKCLRGVISYSDFAILMKAFAAHFGLESFDARTLDKFLWIEGRRLRDAARASRDKVPQSSSL